MNNQHAANTAMISFSSVSPGQEPEMINFVKEVVDKLLYYGIDIVTGASIFNNGLAEFFEEILKKHDNRTTIEVCIPECLYEKYVTEENKDFIAILEETKRFSFCVISIPENAEEDKGKNTLSNQLTAMRFYLVDNSGIFVMTGGKTEGYLGSMPGLEEELRLVEEKIKHIENKYIFLYDRFGGVINKERIKSVVSDYDPDSYALNLVDFGDMLENRRRSFIKH